VRIEIVYSDLALVVIHKPAGLLSVPGRGPDKQDCASRQIQNFFPDAQIVHRLDMATSGLMVFARGTSHQRTLNQAFADRTIQKRYLALVCGWLPVQTGWQIIDLPIAADWERRPLRIIDPVHGKSSLTRWRCIGNNPAHQSRLELEPITGRSHQLRVHLQAIGHPIVGDGLYGSGSNGPEATRLYLHASHLTLPHPESGCMVHFACPADF
jgi:tRNA pseudouridine32 synthase / 23S rRNA pseudouridine746 synthase